ncbi:Ulp1 protease family, C-terminal catalytic domain [Sesbania bispinosa]|nr:Ulp1 protease family, C-terminal catalytic domain [Sesbania bispinosa]
MEGDTPPHVEFNTFSGSLDALKGLVSAVRNMEQGVKDTLMRLDDMEQTNKVMLAKLTITEHVRPTQSNDNAPRQTPLRDHMQKSSEVPNSFYSHNNRHQPLKQSLSSSSQRPTSLKMKQPFTLSNISSIMLDISDDDLDIQQTQEHFLTLAKAMFIIFVTNMTNYQQIPTFPSSATRTTLIGRKLPFKPSPLTDKKYTKDEPTKNTRTNLQDNQDLDESASDFDLNSIIEEYAPESCTPFGVTMPKIYVPIQEQNGHWYLAVVSLAEKVIYHMDPNVAAKDLDDRQRTIRILSPKDNTKIQRTATL